MEIKPSFATITILSFLIFVSSFLSVYLTKLNNLTLQSEDFLAIATVPFSIIKEGNLDLNEYYKTLSNAYPQPDDKTQTPYYLKQAGEKYYSSYPMFAGFLSIPFYIIPAILNLDNSIETIRIMSRLAGAAISALSVGFFFLLLQNRLKSNRQVLLLTIIYAFATNTFSTSSQGLWQQTSSQLLFTAGILLLTYKKYGLAGLIFGFSYMARPTNIISIVIFGLYILWINRKSFNELLMNCIKYASMATIPFILDALLNRYLFGSLLNIEYGDRFGDFYESLLVGTAGLWISPSKGVLIVSPILIFIFYGVYKYVKSWKSNPFEIAIVLIIFFHTLTLGKWYAWYGGYAWGYRMMTEMIPYMVLLLIPFITSKYFVKKPFNIIFWAFFIFSIFTQLLGILMFDGNWHTLYDGKPGWLWDIKNSQMIFAIERILFKLGIGNSPYAIQSVS